MLLLAALLFVQSLKHVDSSPLPDAEHGSQGDWLGRVLHYMESNPETVEELMTKKYGVSEGDMVLSTDRNAVKTIWLSPAIPYVISPELESRTGDILAAMAMLSKPTCVSFHKRTYETDYLYFIKSKGCASYVGFMGGVQTVFIAPECIVGNIAHELIHALGFHHEHTRTDREDYVTVLQENIMEGKEKNFQKRAGETFNLRYDVASIMHYGSEFFSANGLPTIVPKVDEQEMGQRVKLSKTDIKKVCLRYNCAASKKPNWC
ncbi:zinc metalloproteinase nas-4 isoform X2 [Cottoperca gobio]|uniref:Metalloendopeptidase n=1 Tax=Cottoperca gobio TaxID=56716 RepID=A0A6J2QRW2_COTGO|nr:zinc metalloproteinase nas-4-like isoform X2 [Cottoperca gobio]